MQVVQTLLEQLFDREDATVRLIFNCLYDVGIINLISHRISLPPAQNFLRGAAQIPKPIFKAIAMRWIRKNCPPLIVKWLYSQVKARTAPTKKAKATAKKAAKKTAKAATEGVVEAMQPNAIQADAAQPKIPESDTIQLDADQTETSQFNAIQPDVIEPNVQAKLEAYNREVLKLTAQVKMLTVLLIGVTFTLGGGFAWVLWRDQAETIQSTQTVKAIDLEPLHPVLLQAIKPSRSN